MIYEMRKYFLEKYSFKINFNIFKNIFFLFSLSYFIYCLIFNNEEISFNVVKQIYYLYFCLSLFSCILSIFFNALAWKNIIIWFGYKKKLNNLISFYLLSNSLKYVPGGIWHFIERFNFLKDIIGSNLALYVNIIEPYIMLSSSLLLTSMGFIYNPIFLLFLLPIIFLHRNLIYFLIIKLKSFKKVGLKILNITNTKRQFEQKIRIRSYFPFKVLSIEIIFIIFKYIGFILCFYTFNNGNDLDYYFIFIIFCLSWSLGLIIPTAPSGLGVFEGTFLFLIGNNYPQSQVIATLIIFRLISSSADLLLSAPFLLKKVIKRY